MSGDSELLLILEGLELSARIARIRFRDGEIYSVRVISTTHAEAGGDVIAEVLQAIQTTVGDRFPVGSFMNFQLADTASIDLDGRPVFSRSDDPPLAP